MAGQLRYGAHTDWQGYTLLWQDHNVNGPQCAELTNPPSGGLQVQVEVAEIPETVAMASTSSAPSVIAASCNKSTPHNHMSRGAIGGDVDAGSSEEGGQRRYGGDTTSKYDSVHSAGDLDREGASGHGDPDPATRRRFVDCPPVARGFTVNAGDLIEVWTNGVFRSCVHRVANPTARDVGDGGNGGGNGGGGGGGGFATTDARLSLVMFTGPTPDTLLTPIPSCVSVDNPAPDSPVTTAGQHLLGKIEAASVAAGPEIGAGSAGSAGV